MEDFVRTIEQACNDFQVPDRRAQAEATLLEFRRSARPQQACQFILEHSSIVDAHFQAAVTLREGTMRDWVLLSTEERQAIRTFCLRYVLVRTPEPPQYVRGQLMAVVACILKRSWVESGADACGVFLGEVEQAVASVASLTARKSGLQQLAAVISEFAPATSSPMGMPFEFHERCRTEFEMQYLQQIFVHAVQKSRELAASGAPQQSTDGGVCDAGLKLMTLVLSWDFQRGGLNASGGFGYVPEKKDTVSENTLVHPGESWRGLLLAEEASDWVLALQGALRGGSSPLLPGMRQVLVQLSSLVLDFFPSNDGGTARHTHLQRMLQAVAVWVWPPQQVVANAVSGAGGAEEELLDGCRAVLALASIHPAADLDMQIPACGEGVTASGLMASLLCECLKVGGLRADAEGTWVDDAIGKLLEAWVALLQPSQVARCTRGAEGANTTIPPNMLQAVAGVFQTYVQAALEAAAAEAFVDDEGEDKTGSASARKRDEQLAAVAVIGRSCLNVALPLLDHLIAQREQSLRQFTTSGADCSACWEEMCVLLRLSAHVLADDGDGETPLIPEAIIQMSHQATQTGAHDLAEQLSWRVLRFGALAADQSTRALLSPRVVEALLWTLARWADTYLIPEDSGGSLHHATQSAVPPKLAQAFGEASGGGAAALGMLVSVVTAALLFWPGETEVQAEATTTLLPVLVRRRALCRHLASMDAWKRLAGSYARREAQSMALKSEHHRWLLEALLRVVTGMSDTAAIEQYVTEIVTPLIQDIKVLASRPDKEQLAQRADTSAQLLVILEGLRGAVRATHPRSQPIIFRHLAAGMDGLVALQVACRNSALPTLLILKLAEELVEAHSLYVTCHDAEIMCQYCLQVVRHYSESNAGKLGQAEASKEQYKQLVTLLKLLTHLTGKELQEMGAESATKMDVTQVVFMGLHLVIPLISPELLKFPKLCRQYFRLVAVLLEVHPEQVAKLAPEPFRQVMTTLDFGLTQADSEVSTASLEAMAAISRFHFNEMKKGQPGLGQHLAPTDSAGGNLLTHYLEVVLRRLLFEECKRDFAEQAADALLPMIMCEPGGYSRTGHGLLAGQTDDASRGRVAEALTTLMTANGLTQSCDRVNMRRFRRNLHAFLANVRGLVQTK